MKEKLQVQCQAEKVHSELQNQVKILEIDVEEKISKLIEMEQEKNAELTDLRQQNQALEKQLENLRKFVDVSIFSLNYILKSCLCWLDGQIRIHGWMDRRMDQQMGQVSV